jgi:hypothetical protein
LSSLFTNRSFNTFRSIQFELFKEKLSEIRGCGQADSRKWLIKHLFPQRWCKKQINKQNYYLLRALLQSGSVPELDMHVSKHFLRGQFIHSVVL